MKTIPCLPSFLILLSTASGQELTLKPIRQVSIAESGQPSKGIYGLGRAPKSIQQFQGMSVTYLQFQIPKLPKGQAIIRGQLKLHADYISSKKYTPRAWANVVRGQLPETFDWANQPPSIQLTRTRAVEVKEPGPFVIDIPEGLQSGQDAVLRVAAGGGGHRWLWWREGRTPELEIWTGSEDQVISVMAASRDAPLPPDRELPSLMPSWRKMKSVPILQYFWPKTTQETRAPTLDDYLEMGFTGAYKSDSDAPHGGRLFLDRGHHGFMLQSPFANRGKPVIGHDGKPAAFRTLERLGNRRHPYCNSIFSPDNVESYYAYLIRFGREYGLKNLFHAGDAIVMSSWDETGLYSRKFMDYGYSARVEFAAFLKDVAFKDDHPNRDTNGDGRTFNSETGLRIEDWSQVPMPLSAGGEAILATTPMSCRRNTLTLFGRPSKSQRPLASTNCAQ